MTLALLLMAALAVLVASVPIVATAIEGARPDGARRGIERAVRERGWAVGPPKATDNRYAPEPMPRWPHRLLDQTPRRHGGLGNVEGRAAFARTPVALLDRADHEGEAALTVGPDDALIIVRDTGKWLLIATRRGERVRFGWTTRDQVMILP